jgi:hypothetical protein
VTARPPLRAGRYICRVFADSAPVLREKRGGLWFEPGSDEAIRLHASCAPGRYVTDRLYAEILPTGGGNGW